MAIDNINKVLEEILFFSVVRQNPSSWEPGLSFNKGVLDLKIGQVWIFCQRLSFIRAATLSLLIIQPDFCLC